MYDLIDRPVSDLDQGGAFFVWAMRSWLCADRNGHCPPRVIGPGFARRNLVDALQPFHRAMLTFDHFALERFSFNRLECRHVSEHEAILIALVRRLGRDDRIAAREIVARLVDEDRVGDCLAALAALALAMDRVSLLPGIAAAPSHPGSSRPR